MKQQQRSFFFLFGAVQLILFFLSGCEGSVRDTEAQLAPSQSQGEDAATPETPSEDTTDQEDLIRPRDLGYFSPLIEECCTKPGAAAECWMNDAENDGVLCDSSADCPSSSCDLTKGRCKCESDDECNDGICVNGVCGPSWCNGYLKCSCWGGCDWWTADSPTKTLHEAAEAQGMFCCEGVYAADPVDVDPALGGFFSQTPCNGCETNEECDDNNPCTADQCVENNCVHTKLTGTLDAIPDAAKCPFNDVIYANDCARASCDKGACAVETSWRLGQSCSDTPDDVPAGYHPDCFTRVCSAGGTCSVVVLTGQPCNVGQNDCSQAVCDAGAQCVDAPLDSAGLAAHAECCDPAVTASFNDGHTCTDDYCCQPGSTIPSCSGIAVYTQRNVPNYDPANPGDCCLESTQCNDGNGCTQNICCGTTNAGLAACGGDASDPSWECVAPVKDIPGCCDDTPANLADNCNDLYACTQHTCCTPNAVLFAGVGDPCFGATEYHCSDANIYSPLPAGCCDPAGNAAVDCADGNQCTSKSCDANSFACDTTPLPSVAGCCGPAISEACDNEDANACTVETCCSPARIAGAPVGDPCFGASEWQCGISVSNTPGCCTDAADCNDGNPCTYDSCVNNICQWGPLSDLSAVARVCCDTQGDNDAQCGDANDPGACTQNVCCSPAMIASAVSGDPCFAADDWSCQNPVENPVPEGCCDGVDFETECNPNGNTCADASCVNHNCQWVVVTPAPGNECCTKDADCPAADSTNPCLATATCSQSDDPIINTNWGQCDLTFKASGASCGNGDDCFDNVCGDPALENLDCTVTTFMASGTSCTPNGPAPACGTYACDGAGNCAKVIAVSGGQPNETCATLIDLGDAFGGISTTGSNECAQDTYEPVRTGKFTACDRETYGDVVYTFSNSVGDAYDLKHSVVKVTDPSGDWDPVVYTRTECTTDSSQTRCNDDCTFAGTNYNSTDYGFAVSGACTGTESTVVAGPYAVADIPSHNAASPVAVSSQDFDRNNVRDGYNVVRDHITSLIVDSQYSLPSAGGDFNLNVSQESHNNNDCREIGSYAGAPTIDGNFTWKQRWRGTMTSGNYKNYFGTGIDPHQAFFKLEIPAGSGQYLAYVDWNAMDRKGELGNTISMDAATASASFFPASLSRLWADSINSQECSRTDTLTVKDTSGLPVQVSLDASGATYENAWLAVGNQSNGDYGDYELAILKRQPDFFGFFNSYSGSWKPGDFSSMNYFDGSGDRLDFIPSGTADNGYVMTISDIGEGPDTCPDKSGGTDNVWDMGWLVHPFCYGIWGNNWDALFYDVYNSDFNEIFELPFKFPLGNETYEFAYVDHTGRISLLKSLDDSYTCSTDSQCSSNVGACNPSGTCVCTSGRCVHNPGGADIWPDAKKMFSPPEAGGYAPVIAGAWGTFKHRWANGDRGYTTVQTIVFEGTTAFVVTWMAMEIADTSVTDSFSTQNKWNHFYARPGWQVILRVDGRIVFYYRPGRVGSTSVWDEAVSRGNFFVGITGGTSTVTCDSDQDCRDNYFSDAQCDGNYWYWGKFRSGSDKCFRQITPLIQGSNGIGNE
ncbi:MAG: hypothetical protein JXR76_29845 [Deltaproteobacteria bacterium]|nr:hypothetical protein [Deltaproteobacteria bacterium]